MEVRSVKDLSSSVMHFFSSLSLTSLLFSSPLKSPLFQHTVYLQCLTVSLAMFTLRFYLLSSDTLKLTGSLLFSLLIPLLAGWGQLCLFNRAFDWPRRQVNCCQRQTKALSIVEERPFLITSGHPASSVNSWFYSVCLPLRACYFLHFLLALSCSLSLSLSLSLSFVSHSAQTLTALLRALRRAVIRVGQLPVWSVAFFFFLFFFFFSSQRGRRRRMPRKRTWKNTIWTMKIRWRE